MKNNCDIMLCIEKKIPASIGKIGGTEGKALSTGLNPFNKWIRRDRIKRRMNALYDLSGVFPNTTKIFDRFVKFYSEDVLPNVDYLVNWRGEDDIYLHRKLNLSANWITWEALSTPAPWWSALEGKRILVISPFRHTLCTQVARLDKIWTSNELPAKPDNIIIYQCPHYAHLVTPEHSDWFKALHKMQSDLKALPYDVMIIGAGAWSLPMTTWAKSQGKIGIHLGGATQLMFGIIGGRWRDNPSLNIFINDSWINPLKEDIPENLTKASKTFTNDAKYW